MGVFKAGNGPFDNAEPAPESAPGFLIDFISGQQVKDTPEEREAVQIFSRRLIEEFEYPREVIRTRPQFRVRQRPSGGPRSFPVDITVFSDKRQLEDQAYMVVECKRKTVKDGEKQLKLYLTMSSAQIGVWFNGGNHLYLFKKYLPDGTIEWVTLPTLPKFGQSVSDIGLLRRDQLNIPSNLKATFRDIRNHLAGNTTGITRDQELAREIINLLFCKIYDELNTRPADLPEFRTNLEEKPHKLSKRIQQLFAAVKAEYPDVFSSADAVSLDNNSLRYVVGELQPMLVTGATRDAIGEAFEVFIGPAVRGEEGQFFTPRNVVQMMVDILDPLPSETLIDPACGSGGFLIVALEHMWKKLEEEALAKKWTGAQLERKKKDAAIRSIRGIDKDSFLTKITKAYMAIIGDGRGGVFCEDSLGEPDVWRDECKAQIELAAFNVVITNPPFGSKIKVTGTHKLSQYQLARQWKYGKKAKTWEVSDKVKKEQAPQILFIERCVEFLRPGGRLGIVLPESIFGMSNYGYVVQYLYDNFKLRGDFGKEIARRG